MGSGPGQPDGQPDHCLPGGVGGRENGRDRKLTCCLSQVAQIKEKVEEKEGIPPAQQRLIYGGKQM